ncbi:putative structural protein [Enterococcus phage phiM1EF2]|nr:putative structural protein [Enterococcus phage phiM1EF2]
MELADFNIAARNDWLTGDMRDLNTAVHNLLDLLELGAEDVSISEYRAYMEGVSEALEHLTNSLTELTGLFVAAKRIQTKVDKKMEETSNGI